MDNQSKKIHSFFGARGAIPSRYILVCLVIVSLIIPVAGLLASGAGASTNPMYASFDGGGTIGGVTFADDDILRYTGSIWSLYFDGSDVGLLSGVDTTAFALLDEDTALFVFDTTVVLGGVTYEPTDIVQFDGTFGSVTSGTFSLYFNGIDVGLDTTAERIDALSVLADNRILISTTGNPAVPGVTGVDEDILAFTPTTLGADTSGTWEMYFDGSDVELDGADEDTDVVDVVEGNIYLSTAGPGPFSVTGVSGDNQDVFVCSPTSLGDVTACTYHPTLYFDSSAFAAELGTLNLDAFAFYALGDVPTATASGTATNTATATATATNTPTATQPAGATMNPLYTSFDGSGTVGGVTFADDDILRFNGTTWSMFFDGSDVGLLSGPDTTAFVIVDEDTALLVFDSTVILDTVTYEPTDIVQFDGTFGSVTSGTFSLYFNGIDVGLDVPTSERIDALSVLADNRILISTNGNPAVPGVTGVDEDILAFTPTTLGADTSGTWEMYFDGSDVGLDDTADEDTDGVDVFDGKVYLSTVGAFGVSGVTGDGSDIFVCSPTSLGNTTACNFQSALYFDGSTWGQGALNLDGFHYLDLGVTPTDTPTATSTATATFTATPTKTATPTGTAVSSNVHVSIGGTEMPGSPFSVTAGTSVQKSYVGINKGPVKIISDLTALAAERVIYKVNGVSTSFSEMMGLPNKHLNKIYWLPWYNNKSLNTQLRIANVSGLTANVRVFIGGTQMPGSPFSVAAGASVQKSYVGINKGPVKIVSDQNIVAAERVLYKVNGVYTSYSELMGLPNGQLNRIYWLPWYNNKSLNTQLRIANVSGLTANVHVFISGTEMPGSPFSVAAGASVQKSYVGINKGPVKIVSDRNIVAAERVLYKVNGVYTSYSEMMALPNGQLNKIYWLPWYNNKSLNTQLRIANVSGLTANVHVFIGGTEMPGSPFTVAAGASVQKSYVGINKGPVKIVSDQNIVAAERVIYKVNGVYTSYSEMLGLPNGLLDAIYWLPWYNNKSLNTQLRIAVP